MTTVDMAGSAEPQPSHRQRRIRIIDIICIVIAVSFTYKMGVWVGQLTARDSHLTFVCGQTPNQTMRIHPGAQVGFSCGP